MTISMLFKNFKNKLAQRRSRRDERVALDRAFERELTVSFPVVTPVRRFDVMTPFRSLLGHATPTAEDVSSKYITLTRQRVAQASATAFSLTSPSLVTDGPLFGVSRGNIDKLQKKLSTYLGSSGSILVFPPDTKYGSREKIPSCVCVPTLPDQPWVVVSPLSLVKANELIIGSRISTRPEFLAVRRSLPASAVRAGG